MVFQTGTNTTITRYYQSGFEEDEYSDGRNKKTYYISTPDGLTAMRIVSTTAGQTDENLYYVASDYLGSISGLMDGTGSMQQEYSYDAWGARRDPATWQNYTQTQLTTYYSSLITDRGYTGHEMLDLYGLINMNGRMYDPLVGRFLSADPVIQSAGGSQGYNGYSYTLNNPLKYTDPSGYLVSGGYYAPDMHGENRRLQYENNSYYDYMYNRGDFSKGGFGGLNTAIWTGGHQYQVSSSGTLITTNHDFNGLRLDTKNGCYGFWAESFSVENTKVPDDLKLPDGSTTLRTAVLKNVFIPLLGLSKLVENPFSSRVMRQSWENNRYNPMRDVGMMHMGVYPGPSPWMRDFNRAFGTMLNVGMAVPLGATFAPLQFTAKAAGFKFFGSLFWQGIVKHKIDFIDASLDAVTAPGLGSSMLGGGFDAELNLDNFNFSLRMVGYNKTPENALFDAESRILFGSFKSSMNLNVGSRLTGFGDQLMYYSWGSTIIGTVNNGIRNEIFR